MATKGKVPTTGMIQLPMETHRWSQIEKELLNEYSTEAFIQLTEDTKAKVQIVIEHAYSKEGIIASRSLGKSQAVLTTFEDDQAIGLIQAYNVLINAVLEVSWCLIGYTKNGSKKVLICIVAIPDLGYAAYSLSKPKVIDPTLN